jgi:predicted nucleic acid-binding protein
MKAQRVYIDTSVLGGCFDPEFAHWSNALIDDFRTSLLKLVISEIITAETSDAPPAVRKLLADLLTLAPETLVVTPEVLALADAYQEHGILTPKFYADGLHIALATVAEVDLLVSWNFRHIVRYDKIRLFTAVNLERGYKPLAIYSPREVATDEEDNH